MQFSSGLKTTWPNITQLPKSLHFNKFLTPLEAELFVFEPVR